MKKAVLFLITITIFLNIQSKVDSKTYYFDGYNILLTQTYDGVNRGYILEKTGVNPFRIEEYEIDTWYSPSNVIAKDNLIYVFGKQFNRNQETTYDAFLIIYNLEGYKIDKILLDYTNLEEVKDIFFFEDTFILYIYEYFENTEERFELINNHFVFYTRDFEYINEVSTNKELRNVIQNDLLIYGNYVFEDAFNFGITKNLELITSDTYIEIYENQIFHDQVELFFLNECIINNEVYQFGHIVNYPGNYTLEYENQIIHFTVDTTINDIENNKVYNHPVSPKISKGIVTLNDSLFVSGDSIFEPGNYVLSVRGVNDYLEQIHFTINADVSGIINDHIYYEPLTIEFNGTGFLNNQLVTSPLRIEENGEYTFQIKGENNYLETYSFSLNQEPSIQIEDFIQKYDIAIFGIVVAVSIVVFLKYKK